MTCTEQNETTRQGDSGQEFRVSRGNFVGVVQPSENRYKFLVRDRRRERPTIYGCGVDFPNAVRAVKQLMDALTHRT